MTRDFFKFPSTPHLATLPGVDIRDDKVLSEAERGEFLKQELVVEEKVDGANLGVSFDAEGRIRAQNRGRYLPLPGAGQWVKLDQWLQAWADRLFDPLSDRLILFGEWCYARHSVLYNRLPDWFLAFDLYDRQEGRFLSVPRRDRVFEQLAIARVPHIARGRFTRPEIEALLSDSALSDQPAEGIYLRADHGDWLAQRAKLVRSQFIQSIDEHWARTAVKPNHLLPAAQQ